MRKLLALFLIAVISNSFQMWKQCDSRWGNKKLGFSKTDTLCSHGAHVTSVTMAVTSMPTWVDP